jgi:hypothetical protein
MFARPIRLAPLLVLCLAGCGRSPVQQVNVAGTVFLRGRPLPGGMITLVSANGLSATAVIDTDGHFQIKAPVGDGKLGVENRMLLPGASRQVHKLQNPQASNLQTLSGTFVPIPDKYHRVDTSGLTWNVTPGTQTLDIQMD